jgi:hypothetical protein
MRYAPLCSALLATLAAGCSAELDHSDGESLRETITVTTITFHENGSTSRSEERVGLGHPDSEDGVITASAVQVNDSGTRGRHEYCLDDVGYPDRHWLCFAFDGNSGSGNGASVDLTSLGWNDRAKAIHASMDYPNRVARLDGRVQGSRAGCQVYAGYLDGTGYEGPPNINVKSVTVNNVPPGDAYLDSDPASCERRAYQLTFVLLPNNGGACQFGSDCSSGYCHGGGYWQGSSWTFGECRTPVCSDGVKNGLETDQDCGGPCAPCATHHTCLTASDCQSAVCATSCAPSAECLPGAQGICAAPTCMDGIRNGNETDRDCGGGSCMPCDQGQRCSTASDCSSYTCLDSVCVGDPVW